MRIKPLLVGVVAGSVAMSGLLAGCGTTSAEPANGDQCGYVASGEAARPAKLPPANGVADTGTATFVVTTNEGDVVITMDRSKTPCTVNSFESLAGQGFFDATTCHRLTDSGIKVLQCGDPTGTGSGGPGYAFGNETDGSESYVQGVVAMANAGPDTNGSQFFLVWGDSTALDQSPDYTIFGRMDAASVDVVTTIAADGQDSSNGDGDGKPNNAAQIVTVKRR